MLCWDRSDACFCGATRLGGGCSAHFVRTIMRCALLTEAHAPACLLFFQRALGSPFTCASRTALPPPAARCIVSHRLLMLLQRFCCCYFSTIKRLRQEKIHFFPKFFDTLRACAAHTAQALSVSKNSLSFRGSEATVGIRTFKGAVFLKIRMKSECFGERIATPVCALARNDSFFDSFKGLRGTYRASSEKVLIFLHNVQGTAWCVPRGDGQ